MVNEILKIISLYVVIGLDMLNSLVLLKLNSRWFSLYAI